VEPYPKDSDDEKPLLSVTLHSLAEVSRGRESAVPPSLSIEYRICPPGARASARVRTPDLPARGDSGGLGSGNPL